MHEYPLVPLKNIVIFPRQRSKLMLSRPKQIRAIQDAEKGARVFVAVAQCHNDVEDPCQEDIFRMGTLVDIVSVQPQSDGSILVEVEGTRRVQIQQWLSQDPYPRVVTTRVPEMPSTSTIAESLVRYAHELLDRYAPLNRNVTTNDIAQFTVLRSPSRLADVITAHLLKIDPKTQQELLEVLDPEQRLERVCVILGNEIEVLELDQRVRQRVRDQVDRNQQIYYLKEQLQAIQHELGNDIATELNELRDRVKKLGMPEAIELKTLKEIDRLERLPPNSAEIGVTRSYIECLVTIPWNNRSTDRLDIVAAERLLDAEHYGLERVKDRVLDFLAVRQLRAQRALKHAGSGDEARHIANREANRGPILCLNGPPGVGKTSLAASIARAMGRQFYRISLGGIHDEAEIRGHRRTYIGSLPGRIIQAMKQVGVLNPVFLLDEVDKISSEYRGDPAAALLEVLDPEQNASFADHYLDVPYDLSEVFFICTSNAKYNIPRPLLDRMEMIDLPSYTEEEKVAIAKRFLWPKVLRENGLEADKVKLTEQGLRFLIASYTREAGVRALERRLNNICEKVARQTLRKPTVRHQITAKTVESFLGVPVYLAENALGTDQIGVATGMAWTEQGGTLLRVEVLFVGGHGNIRMTGQQGEVMRESADIAHSYIRKRAEALNIPPGFADNQDMHIHLPDGATPKDGPSAGITIAAAILSALTSRPIRADTAMTGELTLQGQVWPIGGLRDKVLAAHRAGIKRIILPEDNRKDVTEVPKSVRDTTEFIFVRHMEEVEAAILQTAATSSMLQEAEDHVVPMVAQSTEQDDGPSVRLAILSLTTISTLCRNRPKIRRNHRGPDPLPSR